MPKIISKAREKIMKYGKQCLFAEGIDQLTARSVARACDIGLGTMYNYFPSKEYLIASIMIDDWQALMKDIASQVDSVQSCLDGLEMVFYGIRKYSSLYRQVWEKRGACIDPSRHEMLVEQLLEIIKPLFSRFDCVGDKKTIRFITENILYIGSRPGFSFADIREILQKIIK